MNISLLEQDAHKAPAAPFLGQGVSSFTLKLIAIVGMTTNHLAYIYDGYLPFALRCVFIGLGGTTFPIMAFLLLEGYRYTSNIRRYAARLALFALIAQMPYSLFLSHEGNVLITLLFCLATVYAYDHCKTRALFWLGFLVILALSWNCDWGVVGPIMILSCHVIRRSSTPLTWRKSTFVLVLIPLLSLGLSGIQATLLDIQQLPYLLYALLGNTLALVLLLNYNGQRGKPLKYFFYAYYPAHIAILGLIKGILLGDWGF